MRPYYEDEYVVLYNADCRDIIGRFSADVLITDPVWPGAKVELAGRDNPERLFRQVMKELKSVSRAAIQIGCDTDPRFLSAIKLPFFRVAWLEYAVPGHKGRLLNTGDVAYLYGTPPVAAPGKKLIPGKCTSKSNFGKESNHPCPRKLEHVSWLVNFWSNPGDVIVDPFCGSGTTLLAAKNHNRKCIGVEIEEKYCEVAVNRLRQFVLELVCGR